MTTDALIRRARHRHAYAVAAVTKARAAARRAEDREVAALAAWMKLVDKSCAKLLTTKRK